MLKIASASTCSGIRLSYKRVWKGTTIGKILSNRAYAGTVEALKTEAVEPRRRSKTTYGKTSSRLRPTEERIKLEGLVIRPVVTEDEFQWVQERRRFNQRFASKNTRNRDYLLKGIIVCPLRTGLHRGVPEKPGVLLLPRPGQDQLGSREMSGREAERSRVIRSRLRDGVPVPERPGDLPG